MTQNTSTAVMARRKEPHDSLDYFPTPPWATRALCEHVLGGADALSIYDVWEPACGDGHMARPLAEYFSKVWASDVHDYGFGRVDDFLFPFAQPSPERSNPDWIITNPPFRLAEEFALRARTIATKGVALLVRTSFLEGVGRFRRLFSEKPPSIIAQFTERVAMVKGRVDEDAVSATAYCWLVWSCSRDGPKFTWIPPCRLQLERFGDYENFDGRSDVTP